MWMTERKPPSMSIIEPCPSLPHEIQPFRVGNMETLMLQKPRTELVSVDSRGWAVSRICSTPRSCWLWQVFIIDLSARDFLFGMLVQDVSAIKMDTGLCCFKNVGIREPTAGSNWELLACCDMELFSGGHENRGQILRLERKETKYICIQWSLMLDYPWLDSKFKCTSSLLSQQNWYPAIPKFKDPSYITLKRNGFLLQDVGIVSDVVENKQQALRVIEQLCHLVRSQWLRLCNT